MNEACTITGLNELEKVLFDMGDKLVRKALRQALDISGARVQEKAQQLAPIAEVGTKQHPRGQLRLDIRRKTVISLQEGIGVCAIYPSRHSFYGAFAEFGTSRQKSVPWLRPAFAETQQAALDDFYLVIQEYLDDFAKNQKKPPSP